jgi:hypothetical protein
MTNKHIKITLMHHFLLIRLAKRAMVPNAEDLRKEHTYSSGVIISLSSCLLASLAFFLLLRQGLLCRRGWPSVCDSSVSAFPVLELQAYPTNPSF